MISLLNVKSIQDCENDIDKYRSCRFLVANCESTSRIVTEAYACDTLAEVEEVKLKFKDKPGFPLVLELRVN